MDVDGVFSWRQIVQIELNHHTVALIHKRGTYAFALCVLEFDANFRGTGRCKRYGGKKQRGYN
jgi:hypothetical protein